MTTRVLTGGVAVARRLCVENADGSCARAVHTSLRMAEVLTELAMERAYST